MQTNLRITIIIIMFVATFTACNKIADRTQIENAKKTTDIANSIAGKWHISTMESTIDGTKGIDPFRSAYKGQQDDFFDFKEGGIALMKQGKNLADLKYVITGNYLVVLHPMLSPDTMTISELTPASLKLVQKQELPFGQVYTKSYTFFR